MDKPTNPRFQPSEGTYVYLLGLVIIATQPSRFWVGLALAATPILIGTVVKVISSRRWRSP